jgi:hypothetical protein
MVLNQNLNLLNEPPGSNQAQNVNIFNTLNQKGQNLLIDLLLLNFITFLVTNFALENPDQNEVKNLKIKILF